MKINGWLVEWLKGTSMVVSSAVLWDKSGESGHVRAKRQVSQNRTKAGMMTTITFRPACVEDVPTIVSLFMDDPHGTTRGLDDRSPESFEQAFEALNSDPNNLVVVADDEGRVVGSMQITFVANLRFEGGRRALIEAVRIAGSHQGQGLGRRFMQHAIDLSRERGCTLVQLNSNRKRTEAIRFYEGLGFEPTHVGFELYP